jgi:hypothetical protein
LRLVIATRRLASPRGSETFVLTLTEALARLGHDVVLFANRIGMVAEEAGRRALTVVSDSDRLPPQVDATIALDRALAIDMAIRFPHAARLYAMHNTLEEWLPPPEPGVVAATLVPNARFETLARGCVGAGEVIRIRQPIDLLRFRPRGWARSEPDEVLLISNYSRLDGPRISRLRQAWDGFDLAWRQLGIPAPTINPEEAMARADIVVGYGRSILEAMACGRPAYVHEHSGSDGWVTAENYARLEADGFAGTAGRAHPDIAMLRADFASYSPDLGLVGHDLIRMHHDARLVAAEIIQKIAALAPPPTLEVDGLSGLKRLAESHMRAEAKAERYLAEAGAAMRLRKIVGLPASLFRKARRRVRKLSSRLGGMNKQ